MKKLYFLLILIFLLAGCNQTNASAPTYKICFTPGNDCTSLIVNTIASAKESIDIQAYSFTSAPIIKALIDAKNRGVNVFILLDKSNVSKRYSVTRTLENYNVPFLIDYRPAIAHNKIMIIDRKAVINGSFNFTKAAQQRNAENVMIVYDKNVAQTYLDNFNLRKSKSESLKEYCQFARKC